MSEKTFRSKISRELRKLGCIVMPIIGNVAGGSGWPDTFIVSNAVDFFIEFKGAKTKFRPIQKALMRRVIEKGTPAYIFREPGIIEDYNEEILATINTAAELLRFVREKNRGRIKQ